VKLGIISAIKAEESKIDWGGSPVEAYARFLQNAGASFEVAGYAAAYGELPATADAHDAYIITGSPSGAYDQDPWITELKRFIRAGYAAKKKFVGICFGHQILAHSLGGRVEKSKKGWGLGLKTHNLHKVKPWMEGAPGQLSLYFAHQDQVERLPANAETLGGSEFCPIGMFAIADQILGIQGHPEFTASQMRDVLKQRRLNGYERDAEEAEATLREGLPDGQMVGRWIVNFLDFGYDR
jgi:GMP synthase (glutamine-hydrolysing)